MSLYSSSVTALAPLSPSELSRRLRPGNQEQQPQAHVWLPRSATGVRMARKHPLLVEIKRQASSGMGAHACLCCLLSPLQVITLMPFLSIEDSWEIKAHRAVAAIYEIMAIVAWLLSLLPEAWRMAFVRSVAGVCT
jgi:hypothetical protein